MTEADDYPALTKLNERQQRLNETVAAIIEADERKAPPTGPNADMKAWMDGERVEAKVHAENIKALLDIVGMLAREIDELRHQLTT